MEKLILKEVIVDVDICNTLRNTKKIRNLVVKKIRNLEISRSLYREVLLE